MIKKCWKSIKLALLCSIIMATVLLCYKTLYTLNDKTYTEVRLQYGSNGNDVARLQSKLSELGLYSGKTDGVYDINTAEAVKNFQKYNNLKETGVCDEETLKLLDISSKDEFNELEKEALAKFIEHIAGKYGLQSMTAVGAVVINRVKSDSFPNSILEVIYQQNAFSEVSNNIDLSKMASSMALRAANDALLGIDPSFDALYITKNIPKDKTVTLKSDKLFFSK